MSLPDMSLAAVPLLLATLLARAALLRRLPKRTFVALWGVGLLRLLVPVDIPFAFSARSLLGWARERLQAPLPVAPLTDIQATAFIRQAAAPATTGIPQAAPPAAGEAIWALLPVWGWVWLAGTCLLAAAFLVSYWHARRRFADAIPMDSLYIRAWRAAHPLRRPLAVRVSDRIRGPLTYGVLRPVILLPKSALALQDAQLDAILAHEFTHIRRFDTLRKRLFAVALCLHWPNPLVWLMVLLAGRDIEMACDEAAVRSVGFARRKDYALTLIDMEETRTHTAPLVSYFSQNATEERIQAIMKMKPNSRKGTILAILLVAVMTLLFATAAGATESAASDAAVTPDTTTASRNQARTGAARAASAQATDAQTDSEEALRALEAEYQALLADYRALLAASEAAAVPKSVVGGGLTLSGAAAPSGDSVDFVLGDPLPVQGPSAQANAESGVASYYYQSTPARTIRLEPVDDSLLEDIQAAEGMLAREGEPVVYSYSVQDSTDLGPSIRSIRAQDIAPAVGMSGDIAVTVVPASPATNEGGASLTQDVQITTDGEAIHAQEVSGFFATLALGDRMTVELGPYDTQAELIAAAEEVLTLQVSAGLITEAVMEDIMQSLK